MIGNKIEVVIDEYGVIQEVTENGEPLNYDPKEKRRIEGSGRIATLNLCCWRCVRGVWMCMPC